MKFQIIASRPGMEGSERFLQNIATITTKEQAELHGRQIIDRYNQSKLLYEGNLIFKHVIIIEDKPE